MTTTKLEPELARRGLWLAVAVVIGLLALSTFDVLRNSGGGSPVALRRAAFDGDEATVRRLIAAHPEWIDLPGSTNGQAQVLGDLYDKAMVKLGKSPAAAASNDPEKRFRNWEAFGATALFHAVAQKHVGTALLLLEAGAHARAKLSTGYTIVPLAIYTGDTNLLAALERRGASLNELEPGTSGNAMHHAAYGQAPEMFTYLLRRNIPLNSTNSRGTTPLHVVAGRARLDLVQLLVTNGADVSLANKHGLNALDAAHLRAAQGADSNAVAVVEWLAAYTATNQPAAKPAP